MKILAVETSCDDTGIAILKVKSRKFKVLSNVVSSQIEVHKKYGGVFPMMAKREHQKNLTPVLTKALQQAKLINTTQKGKLLIIDGRRLLEIKRILAKESELFEKVKEFLETHKRPDVDVIAVTYGPGLEPCLWVGINFAKALSYIWDIPLIPVNHIEAHILVNFLNPKPYTLNVKLFPAISLVVSGGHTQLILVKGVGKYKIIGETRDDAAGECFDKCAKLFGLGYPGGPAIARIAGQWKLQNPNYKLQKNPKLAILNSELKIFLPRPMINTKDYDFSFSGLKTAVLYAVKAAQNSSIDSSMVLSEDFVKQMCFEVQQTIIDVLIKKTIKAAKNYKAKTIILGGGVSANQELRKQLAKKILKEIPNTQHLIPNTQLSTDNALMIAVAGYFHKNKKTKNWEKIQAKANLRISR